MTRSRGILLAGTLFFLLATWSALRGFLPLIVGHEAEGATVGLTQERLWQIQVASAIGGLLNAALLLVAGSALLRLRGWARPFGFVLAFWSLFGLLLGLGAEGAVRVGNLVLLPLTILLVGALFHPSVRTPLSPSKPRPTGVATLGVLYFIQGTLSSMILVFMLGFLSGLWPLGLIVGLLFVVLLVLAQILLGIGLLEFWPRARWWVLFFSWLTVGSALFAWVVVLASGGGADRLGSLIAWSLIGLPMSIFALWYLTRPQVKELFLGDG